MGYKTITILDGFECRFSLIVGEEKQKTEK